MSEKDRDNLLNILDAARKIREYTAGVADADAFFEDERTFDAVLMNFVVIGEAIVKLSDATKSSHDKVPWDKIKGFRNVIAHDYFGVDAEEVWQIVHEHLPEFVEDVQQIMKI